MGGGGGEGSVADGQILALSRNLCCGPEPLGPVRTESDVCLKDNLFSLVPYKARVV
jgi:hypothetical protein